MKRKTTQQKRDTKQTPRKTNRGQSQDKSIQNDIQLFEPRNKSQEQAWQTIKDNHIIFLVGPAGTAKTHLATAYAVSSVNKNIYNQIVVTRPLVEASEHLGWLPGEIDNKVAPYMEPIFTCTNKISRRKIEIIVKPIAYMRGVTFEDNIHILDEAQNCTRKQLQLYLTRFGKRSKIIICGDSDQCDIPNSGLDSIMRDIEGLPKVGVHKFTISDCVRQPLVGMMIERFNETDKKNTRLDTNEQKKPRRSQ